MRNFLLVPLVACNLIAACNRSPSPEAAPAPAPAASAGPQPVDVVTVVAKPLDATLELSAELAPDESVAIYPRVNGFLDDIPVDRGSPIKKGQLLARLSAPELAAQRAEAESKVAAAKSTYDRLKTASATPGAIAGHDLEVAEAGLNAEKSRVDSLRALEAYLVVRAPFDGVVTERDVHPGALVGPPAGPNVPPMLRVEKIDHLRVTVAVPEADAGAVSLGTPATFTVSTYPGQKFTAKVARIAHEIDPRTRTMAVELDFDNTGPKQLVPGAYAEVQWPVHRDAPSLFVPPSAIATTTERTFVDRVRGGKLEQVTVGRGVAMGDLVEVFGDLAAGDQVLKRGSEVMAAGTAVTVRPAATVSP
ncbi:MAG TPA: efflux RND transporter periplasmic adaptor subunit [Kofleriaceae bacterium]|nr:efflux RND transporter periplasmic adaptor subunit [Kofleriaceae bacterium]